MYDGVMVIAEKARGGAVLALLSKLSSSIVLSLLNAGFPAAKTSST